MVGMAIPLICTLGSAKKYLPGDGRRDYKHLTVRRQAQKIVRPLWFLPCWQTR